MLLSSFCGLSIALMSDGKEATENERSGFSHGIRGKCQVRTCVHTVCMCMHIHTVLYVYVCTYCMCMHVHTVMYVYACIYCMCTQHTTIHTPIHSRFQFIQRGSELCSQLFLQGTPLIRTSMADTPLIYLRT